MLKKCLCLEMSILLFLVFIGLISCLIYFDFKQRILPDCLTFSLLWIGLLVNPLLGVVSLYSAVLGAVIGYLSLWGVYWLFKLLCGREGLGYGDFKMLAALGAWLGWQALPLLLVIATSGTLLVLLVLKVLRLYPDDPQIPFGVGLGVSGVIGYLLTIF